MGYGEDYLEKFDGWFASLQSGGRKEYRDRYPEPVGWQGFYAQRRGS